GTALTESFFLLFDGQVGEGLGSEHEPLPVLLDVFRGAALLGNVLGYSGRRHHVDGIPRTPPFTQGAADAAFQIDMPKRLEAWLILSRDFVDAVNRTDFNAGLAAGAAVRTDHR